MMGAAIVAHLVGDYLLQSEWMAQEKTKRTAPAVAHALAYALPFVLLTLSPAALATIAVTHFAIDRWRLARFVVFAKNWIAPRVAWPLWADCAATGYPSRTPPWLATWLLIIADNTLHLLINGAALRWLA